MMKTTKALAVFLSFYIILLSGIPCVDIQRHDTSRNVEISQHPTHDHHNDTDPCSPFCTCQCCQANFFMSDAPSLLSSEAFGINYCEINPNFQSIDLFDFLIPPKS
jgi:hypothetical protein